jgi:hypothetical protein
MSDKMVAPVLGAKSFTCPHCGAISHQTWFKTFAHSYEKDTGPFWPDGVPVDAPAKVQRFVQKMWEGKVFRDKQEQYSHSEWELINLVVNLCYSCSEWSVWVADRLVFPATALEVKPNPEMPADVLIDFIEANTIVENSPCGAAALLRLCIQKLMPHLDQKGKTSTMILARSSKMVSINEYRWRSMLFGSSATTQFTPVKLTYETTKQPPLSYSNL